MPTGSRTTTSGGAKRPAAKTAKTAKKAAAEAPEPTRIRLVEQRDGSSTLDGAWWPYSESLADDLPTLVTELLRRGIRVSRASYNPSHWNLAPRKLHDDGRILHLAWFRSIDEHGISLGGSGTGSDRLELLVVPPDTAPDVAARAMKQAAGAGNSASASEVLTAAAAG